jgi:hypothetical protein
VKRTVPPVRSLDWTWLFPGRGRRNRLETSLCEVPDAASSLREGLEETLKVVRLGVPGALRRTLETTNPVESR